MMTQDRDYEDALRRALTAAAESIEPAGDGLQRIRHRLSSPRSVFSECAEWLELHRTRFLVRLEPVTEAARTTLRRTGPLVALVSFMRRLLSSGAAQQARAHRRAAGSPGRLGPAGPWIKPVLAVSVAVAIVVVGVVILNHETGTLISPSNSVTTPSSQGSGLGGGTTANSKRWKLPLGVKTQLPPGPKQNPRPNSGLPVVACTPTPSAAATTTAPAGGATATPTPTPTPSGSPTSTPATPQPTETGQPTPTPTSSPATGGTAAETATVMVTYHAGTPAIVQCGATPKT